MLDNAKCIFFSSAKEVPESTLELVQIYFDPATFDNIGKDQRLKFDAQISLIGGTIGLFIHDSPSYVVWRLSSSS